MLEADSPSSSLAQSLIDARLPDALTAPGPTPLTQDEVLVTGGTGFFGRHLVAELLKQTRCRIHLPVRAETNAAARDRVSEILQACDINFRDVSDRLNVFRGAVTEPAFGLEARAYEALAERVDLVMHGAAQVNWAKGYRTLRKTNVGGTLEVLRFAAQKRTKAISLISTIAVGFVHGGPAVVDETTPMLRYLNCMPLGYAQTKCVSEELLVQAAARGIPATVVRASLMIGDTVHGRAADNDFTTALIEACVRKGHALDIDWLFECVPVDYAAHAFTGLTFANPGGFERFHLRAKSPRHWREVVLWLSLLGYTMSLEPVPDWLDRQFGSRAEKIGRLYPFRRFFLGIGDTPVGMRPFEIFLSAQRKVDCSRTNGRLAELGIGEPLFDAAYLERCVESFHRMGVLPANPRATERRPFGSRCFVPYIEDGLKCSLQAPLLKVTGFEERPIDTSGGFLNEITAARFAGAMGIRRVQCTARLRPEAVPMTLDIVIKTKPSAAPMQRLLEDVVDFCDPNLGQLFRRFPLLPGLAGSHLREPAVHQILGMAAGHHIPAFYAAWCHEDGSTSSYVSEFVTGETWSGSSRNWPSTRFAQTIDVLARLHHAGYQAQEHLKGVACLADRITPEDAIAATALWRGLADFSDRVFGAAAGVPLGGALHRIIDSIAEWWPVLAALPQTLVHNDLNPRNIIWRTELGSEQPVIFDWELARLGIPQGDVMELLCFVLPRNADAAAVTKGIEFHRRKLEALAGCNFDTDDWNLGARLALWRFGIERLPLYAVAHYIRPQPLIVELAACWARIVALLAPLACPTTRPNRVMLAIGA